MPNSPTKVRFNAVLVAWCDWLWLFGSVQYNGPFKKLANMCWPSTAGYVVLHNENKQRRK